MFRAKRGYVKVATLLFEGPGYARLALSMDVPIIETVIARYPGGSSVAQDLTDFVDEAVHVFLQNAGRRRRSRWADDGERVVDAEVVEREVNELPPAMRRITDGGGD